MAEVLMSRKEYNRLNILMMIKNKEITQLKGAELLKITARQTRNLMKVLEREGENGIISKKRGKRGNRGLNQEVKQKAIHIIYTKYNDFGPTLATEKLLENDQIKLSRETVRKLMIEQYIWIPHIKKKKVHLLRKRKEYFGEMLQGDGSFHDWFENGRPCALIYFIDDATGVITAASFEQHESLVGYTRILREQLENYGIPWSIYTDRFSVFEISQKKESLTQFRRILNSLDIKWIGANSAQAKGRIERCNRTLQDRLVKELRLKGIKTIEEGNRFLKEFIKKHNAIFSKEPVKTKDLHRSLDGKLDLSRILSKYEERTTRNDLTFQFHNKHYRILDKKISGKKIEVRTDWEGNIRIFQKDRELQFASLENIFEEEKIKLIWKTRKEWHPRPNHPWKKSRRRQVA